MDISRGLDFRVEWARENSLKFRAEVTVAENLGPRILFRRFPDPKLGRARFEKSSQVQQA